MNPPSGSPSRYVPYTSALLGNCMARPNFLVAQFDQASTSILSMAAKRSAVIGTMDGMCRLLQSENRGQAGSHDLTLSAFGNPRHANPLKLHRGIVDR